MSSSTFQGLHASICATSVLLLTVVSSPTAAQTVSLPSYNVDINQTSVSGLSAGGYMAVQFDVAFSSMLRGAGIIAGGPFYCAQGSVLTATSTCSCAPFGCFGQSSTNVAQLIAITDRDAGRGRIDATGNLARHKIWLFSGSNDTVVPQRVMDDLSTYYRHYIDAANISYKKDIAAEHAMPTDFFGNSCATLADPFISNCNYDAAGQLLQWIYGNLHPKNTGQLGGSFINFNQNEFIDQATSHGMAPDGWLYVPATCGNKEGCKLHVVFHGCKQYETYRYSSPSGQASFGTTYVRNTGYNKWADANNMIVLYPQAIASGSNPNGCWDWWGYDDPDYAVKTGRQMTAVKRMIDRIASGHEGLPAPANLQATAVADTTISLSWSAVAHATGFNVYRDGAKATSSPVPVTSFTDAGRSPGKQLYGESHRFHGRGRRCIQSAQCHDDRNAYDPGSDQREDRCGRGLIGDAVLDGVGGRDRLRRVPRGDIRGSLREGQSEPGHRNELHRYRADGKHDIFLRHQIRGCGRWTERPLYGSQRQDRGAADLLHGHEFRPRGERSSARQLFHRRGQRLEPGAGPRQRVHRHHAEADRPEFLRDRLLPLTLPRSGRLVPQFAATKADGHKPSLHLLLGLRPAPSRAT